MKANLLLISSSFKLLGLSLFVAITGCQQPYSYSPYGPYQQNPYGQPAYGQPMAPGGFQQPGVVPGSGSFGPPISSPPVNGNWQVPSTGSGSNSAPKFDPNNPGIPPNHNQVPNYPSNGSGSPYFESSSTRIPQNTFVAKPGSPPVSQAGFAEIPNQPVSQPAAEPAMFELPSRQNKNQNLNQFQNKNRQPAPVTDPFSAPLSTPREASLEFTNLPLAPPLATKKQASFGDALEGTARKISPKNEWVLEFASTNNPFGGKLPLTATPEILNQLKDGRKVRLQGFLETKAGLPANKLFHIEQVQHLESPFPSK